MTSAWPEFAHLNEAEHGLSVRTYTMFDRQRRLDAGFGFIAAMLDQDGADLVYYAVDPIYYEERVRVRPPAPPWCSRCGSKLTSWPEEWGHRYCGSCGSADVYINGPALRREALKGLEV